MSLWDEVRNVISGIDQHPDTTRVRWLLKHVDDKRPGFTRLCITFKTADRPAGTTFEMMMDEAIRVNPDGPPQ